MLIDKAATYESAHKKLWEMEHAAAAQAEDALRAFTYAQKIEKTKVKIETRKVATEEERGKDMEKFVALMVEEARVTAFAMGKIEAILRIFPLALKAGEVGSRQEEEGRKLAYRVLLAWHRQEIRGKDEQTGLEFLKETVRQIYAGKIGLDNGEDQ